MTKNLLQKNQALALAGPAGNSLDAYMQAVSAIPVLSAEEERALATRYRQDDDLDAARELVLSHLRFVVHIARGYRGYGLPTNDLIQEGNIGLMKAVKRFDPEVGVRLVSFAVHWIRAEIHEFVLRNWRIVKVATTKAQRKLFFNLRKAKTRLGWFSHDEVQAVADDLGVSPDQVLEMEQRLSSHDTAYDAPTDADSEDGDTWSPAVYLTSEDADPAVAAENDDWEANNEQRLGQAMIALDDRSRDIVQRRWLADNKTTLQDLAQEYNVSAERIRQLENNAIKKLRGAMAG